MAKPEWGTKRFCDDCGTRFYDLNRAPATCPKCGTRVKVVAKPKARRLARPAPKPAPAPTQDNLPPDEPGTASADSKENLEIEGGGDTDNGDDNAGVMAGASDLTDDGDDVSEVMEHVEKGAEDKA